jgi:hypothetical protein
LYASPNIIRVITVRKIKWAGHVAYMRERNAYSIWVGEPERKRPLGRPSHRWEGNIISLREIGQEGVDCMHLAQDRDQWLALMNTIMNH